MSQKNKKHDGSKSFDVFEWLKIVPEEKPQTQPNTSTDKNPKRDSIIQNVRVRRSKQRDKWVTTDDACTEATLEFTSGIMKDVKFNNQAIPMNLFGQDTDADAYCKELHVFLDSKKGNFKIPSGITYTARIYYARSKGGIAIRNSSFVVQVCDYVLLNLDGTSTCCWIKKPDGAPLQEKF